MGGQGELSLDPDLGKITKLDVSLKTFQNQTPENTTSPNPGTVCKKALMTVTAEASLAGLPIPATATIEPAELTFQLVGNAVHGGRAFPNR